MLFTTIPHAEQEGPVDCTAASSRRPLNYTRKLAVFLLTAYLYYTSTTAYRTLPFTMSAEIKQQQQRH